MKTKTAALAALLCIGTLGNAHAQSAGDFLIGGGWQDNGGASAAAVQLTYFATDHIAGEVSIATPSNVAYTGGSGLLSGQDVGTGKLLTSSVSAKFFFGNADWPVRPFVGIGMTINTPTSTHYAGGLGSSTASVKTGVGPLFSVGANWNATAHLFATASIAYSPRPTMGSINTPTTTETKTTFIKLRQSDYLAYVGIGYRF